MLTSCKRISAVVLVLCLPVAAATPTVLASIALGGQPSISVEHAWSRATPVGADVAVGYFTIKNTGATPDRLVSITTDIASHSAIHQMSMTDSMMKMRQVTEGLPVPAHGAVMLEPGSYHLMFDDLKRPLKGGESFSATLVFEKAGKMDVTFEVQGIGQARQRTDCLPSNHKTLVLIRV